MDALLERTPSTKLLEWGAYFELLDEEAEERQLEAGSQHRLKGRTRRK